MDINANELENKVEVNNSEGLNESDNINANKEVVKQAVGDVESSHSESSKTVESREDRIKRLKEQSETERQRKLAEIIESQKLSHELRQKQQMERRKKIEELKSREEERRKGVEQRRRELDEKEKEKNESIQKRNKEREARAARNQKPLRAQVMSNSMTQSMISPRQGARMTTSMHSNGTTTSSGSEKCMKKASYGRWPSSCDVDRVSSSFSSPAAGKAYSASSNHNNNTKSRRSASNTGKRQLLPPEGFLEVDGHFIPASTRHAGCFLPYKGPQYRVKGVLAWGPPPPSGGAAHNNNSSDQRTNEHGTSVSWWAGLDAGAHRHNRASSAHNPRGNTYPSVPCNIDTTGIDNDSTSPVSSRPIKENIVVMSSGIENIKGKLANRKLVQSIPPIRMVKAFSQHHISINVSSPEWNSGKDLTSPRSKNRSVSRSNVTASVAGSLVAPSDSKPTTRKPKEEKLLFERLSKPRSGSQPPKMLKEPGDTPSKIMVSSFNKQPVKNEKFKNKDKKLTTSVISLEPNNQKKEMIELPQTQIVDDNKDVDTTENTNNTTEDVSSTSKSGSRRGSKNLSKTSADVIESGATAPVVGEEVAYKMKLAEQRRIAREKKEEQELEKKRVEEDARQRFALEKKRVEEEARQMIEEETRRAKILEEEQLAELERQRLLDEAEKKKKEDTQRELEEKRLEDLRLADEERMIRKRKLEMIMRRVKQPEGTNQTLNDENLGETVPVIMVDDKKQDSLMEISLQENVLGPVDSSTRDNSPQRTVAWDVDVDVDGNEDEQIKLTNEKNCDDNVGNNLNENANLSRSNSPEIISDTVLNLTGPETINSGNSVSSSYPLSTQSVNTTPAGDQPPQFKSKLLNSMLNQGRLNSNKPQDDKINSFVDSIKEKRNSLYISPVVSDSYNTDVILPHSKSYDADLSHLVVNGISHNQAINGLSSESEADSSVTNGDVHHPNPNHNHQMDTYNAITLSNSTSNIDPPRLSLDKLELRSDSTCSQFSSEDCPPSMQPSHSQALELS